jgi:rubrerythrin
MDLLDALNVAIDNERTVRDHYAQCAHQVQDPQGRKVFAIMAREEQGHVEYLESRLGEWRSKGVVTQATLPTVLPPVATIRAEAGKIAPVPGQVPVQSPELEALKRALALEHQASAFYRDLVGKLDATGRSLFERFLEIEDGHVLIVQAEIDALAGHGHWFDFMEFSLEQ